MTKTIQGLDLRLISLGRSINTEALNASGQKQYSDPTNSTTFFIPNDKEILNIFINAVSVLWSNNYALPMSLNFREQSASCFVLSRQKHYVGMVVYISWLHTCLCVWM